MSKLDVRAFAMGIGAVWAIYVFSLGLMAKLGWGKQFVKGLSSVYLGYEPTLPGSVVGAFWAFLDGAVAGAVIALVYNRASEADEKRAAERAAEQSPEPAA